MPARYLEWVLRLDPPLDTRVDALYWLSRVAETPAEQLRLIEEALAYDPSDMRCRRALAVARGELKSADIIDPDTLAEGALRVGAPEGVPQAPPTSRWRCPCGAPTGAGPVDNEALTGSPARSAGGG